MYRLSKGRRNRHKISRKTGVNSDDPKNPLSINSWKQALPWEIAPKRFLPNFYTYARLLNVTEKSLYPRGNIVYIHVPKSGGTTMGKCFNSAIKKLKRYSNFYGPIGESGIEPVLKDYELRGNSTKAAIFSGEYAFGLCERLGKRPCSYFLMMREPYSRLISSYLFCKRHSNDGSKFFCALNVNNMTVTEWALTQRSFLFRQLLMNEQLCEGAYDYQYDFEDILSLPKGLVKDKMPCWMKLQALIDSNMSNDEKKATAVYLADSLEQWFAGVGVLEDMDETLEALNVIYGLPVYPTCTKLHSNKAPTKNKKEDDKLKKQYMNELKASPKVEEALYEDIVLYKRVQEIARSQRAARKYVLMGE